MIEIDECWSNGAPVRVRRRHVFRRRQINSPFARRVKAGAPTDPKVGRRGAASMNFALGPAEMIGALREKRACRLGADFALHFNEVTLAIQNSRADKGVQVMTTRCDPVEPLPWTLAAAPRKSRP